MPTTTISLRPMTPAEYTNWRRTDEATYAQEKAAALNISIEQATTLSRDTYLRLLPNDQATPNNFLHAVCNAEGLHVGDLWYTIATQWNATTLFISSIEINPTHLRRGYGLATMALLETEATKHHATRIALHVVAANKSAIALYEKAGYFATDISMAKDITQK